MLRLKVDEREIQKILSRYVDGLTLDGLLVRLQKDLTNENRVLLTRKLQWNEEIVRVYQEHTKKVYTIYKLKK